MKWLRRILLGLAGLLALIALLVATLNVMSMTRQRKRYEIPPDALTLRPTTPPSVERGRHLATAVAPCVDCHGADLGGEAMNDDAVFGRFMGTNLTSGKGGVGAAFTEADWVRAIRHGVARDGRSLIFMPSGAFQALSDDDLASLIAYVRSVPPVDREMPSPRPGPLARLLHVAGALPLLPAELVDHAARSRGTPPAGVTPQYGEYLATGGGCRECHAANLGGGNGPNITRGRLRWTEAQFLTAMREGTRPDGSTIDEAMPWKTYAKMTDEELRAIYAYVRSVPPVAAE